MTLSRRLFLLILWAVCSLQLALAGVPVAGSTQAASPMSTPSSALVLPCASHDATGAPTPGQPCESSPACEACTLCQMCHPTALQTSPWPQPDLSGPTSYLPVFTVGYLSAHHAPGFRPPIL